MAYITNLYQPLIYHLPVYTIVVMLLLQGHVNEWSFGWSTCWTPGVDRFEREL